MIDMLFFVVFLPLVALVGALFIGLLMAGAVVGVGEHLEERRESSGRFARTVDYHAARTEPTRARAA